MCGHRSQPLPALSTTASFEYSESLNYKENFAAHTIKQQTAMASPALSTSFLPSTLHSKATNLTLNLVGGRLGLSAISGPLHWRTLCISPTSQLPELSERCDSSRRKAMLGFLSGAGAILICCDKVGAVSTSKRALRAQKIPESDYTTLPNGLKYYDLKVGSGPEAVKGSRVAVHYVVKWKGVTFMTSRQGMGVTGGTPYGFDVGASGRGTVLKGLDLGVQGMKVGGQRLLIVPPELAYGDKGIQEIPPNATLEFDLELLAIKQSPFGTSVKIVEG